MFIGNALGEFLLNRCKSEGLDFNKIRDFSNIYQKYAKIDDVLTVYI